MRRILIVLIATVIVCGTAGAQVTVTGGYGEDTDTRPKGPNDKITDESGEYWSPEADGIYDTAYAAIDDLLRFNGGGTVVIADPNLVDSYPELQVDKPLEVIGAEGASKRILGVRLTISGTEATFTNIKFRAPVVAGGGADVEVSECIFGNQAGRLEVQSGATALVSDCSFELYGELSVDGGTSTVSHTEFAGSSVKSSVLSVRNGGNVTVRDSSIIGAYAELLVEGGIATVIGAQFLERSIMSVQDGGQVSISDSTVDSIPYKPVLSVENSVLVCNDVQFRGSPSPGLSLGDHAEVTLNDCAFLLGTGPGISVYGEDVELDLRKTEFAGQSGVFYQLGEPSGIVLGPQSSWIVNVEECTFADLFRGFKGQSAGISEVTAKLGGVPGRDKGVPRADDPIVVTAAATIKDSTFSNCLLGIFLNAVGDVSIEDCRFVECQTGVTDDNMQGNGTYRNLHFENIEKIGINLRYYGFSERTIEDCRFVDCKEWGIYLNQSKNVTIRGIFATRCGSGRGQGGGAGIGGGDTTDLASTDIENILIEDCECRENSGNGFYLVGPGTNITLRNSAAVDNGKSGICFIDDFTDITIEDSWIAGNSENGIWISNSSDWKIYGNTIGLDEGGRTYHSTAQTDGIRITNPDAGVIGARTTPPGKGNVISGHLQSGILIEGRIPSGHAAREITIFNNLIGTSGNGVVAIPNRSGIVSTPWYESQNVFRITIGGDNPSVANKQSGDLGMGNVIYGNVEHGIHINSGSGDEPSGLSYGIVGNYIGVDQTGLNGAPFQFQFHGVYVSGNHHVELLIGEQGNFASGNVISGAVSAGIYLDAAANVSIYHNVIGAGVDGEKEVGNGSGILLSKSRDNIVGHNTILYNGINGDGEGYGVLVIGSASIRNKLTENLIHRNLKHGIRIGNEANAGIKPPILDRVFIPGQLTNMLRGRTTVRRGTIEVFLDPVFQKPGYWGQGKDFFVRTTADEEGNFEINLDAIQREEKKGIVTATVTDTDGNTSEFSPMMTPVVTQVVGREGDMLVAGKPTIVRLFGDTGYDGPQIHLTGHLLWDGLESRRIDPLPLQLFDNEHPFQDKLKFMISKMGFFDERVDDRKLAKNSLNFRIGDPWKGWRKLDARLSSPGDGEEFVERADFTLGTYNFQDTRVFSVNVYPVISYLPDTNPTIADLSVIQPMGVRLSTLYPVNSNVFVERFRQMHPIVYPTPPHSRETRMNLLVNVFVQNLAYRGTNLQADYGVALVSRDIGFSPPDNVLPMESVFDPDMPTVAGIIDKTETGDLYTGNWERLAHEIGHMMPFNLGDSYAGGHTTERGDIVSPGGNIRDESGKHILEEYYAFDMLGHVFPQEAATYGFNADSEDYYPGPKPVFTTSGGDRPAVIRDFMGEKDPVWVDPGTYRVLFEALGGSVSPSRMKTYRPQQAEISPALIVIGSIGADDSADLYPLQHLDTAVANHLPAAADSPYKVELLDGEGTVLESRNISVVFKEVVDYAADDSGEDGASVISADVAPFTTVLTDDPAAQRLELKKGDTVLAFLEKSPSTPVVHNISINERDDLSADTFELTWTASDDDPGDTEKLTFSVLYTPDAGATILPIACSLTGVNSTIVYTAYLPASGEPKFIVRASDGWNEGELMSGLPVSIDNHEPSVQIAQPADGQSVFADRAVSLSGFGYDVEDGLLVNNRLLWQRLDNYSILGRGS
ncbi:MAG: right-handed parallel beta-helix repeat-containing protein, partial [bacterium]